MRILFALPGLHRYSRGAEVAFQAVAEQLSRRGEEVSVMGSGLPKAGATYRFIQTPSIRRERLERLPSVAFFRTETAYEEASFVPGMLWRYRPKDYDVTVTCSYPFLNWALRRPSLGSSRPRHVFVTQNGDWPAYSDDAEFRFFGCDGLVCTNPDFFERNRNRWNSTLIPNGVNIHLFSKGPATRDKFDLPTDRPVILMVSALIPSKRVIEGIAAVGQVPDAHLVVAGDGPLRESVAAAAKKVLPGRFSRISVSPDDMPDLYRSADVFLHLSTDESFGNVFVEALACGLPVVAHDSARTRWVVGEHQYLTDTSSSDTIAAQLSNALKAPAEIKSASAARAREFSWESVGEKYQTFFGSFDDIQAHSRRTPST